MMISLTRLDKAMRDEPVQLIATVHDEAVLLVPGDSMAVERIGAIAQREMIAAFLDVFPDAPTFNLVDPAVGPPMIGVASRLNGNPRPYGTTRCPPSQATRPMREASQDGTTKMPRPLTSSP
jgi:hypothetical protein